MPRIQWDSSDERFYETGLDRGVLYFPSRPFTYDDGVAWNGLVSVSEDFGEDKSVSMYFDGVKYMDQYVIGDSRFTLSAYTYPDEFLAFEGFGEIEEGLYLDDQWANMFALSFRTRIGNNNQSEDYKIHILYNLMTVASASTYETLTDSANPIQFKWTLQGKPENAPGFRPTAYVIFDTRFLSSDIVEILEQIIYGTEERIINPGLIDGLYPDSEQLDQLDGGTPGNPGLGYVDGITYIIAAGNPTIPSLADLIAMVTNLRPRYIRPHPSGIADLIPGEGDLSQTSEFGIYWSIPGSRLMESAIPGLYILSAMEEASQ